MIKNSMKLGGLQKTSLVDYPGKMAATVFTKGCNFRCPFCHNPDLVDLKRNSEDVSEDEFFDFLKQRKGLLDAVCITGGEPLIHNDIVDFMEKIKDFGFDIKLDTNGNFPEKLEILFQKELLDYVAMDVKSSPEKYRKLTNTDVRINDIAGSVELIKKKAKAYEFRTTAVPTLIDAKEIEEIGKWTGGGKKFALQKFENGHETLDKSWQKVSPYSDEKMKQIVKTAEKYFDEVELRGL